MALTAEEQKFFDFAKDALPAWIPDGDEFLMGAAKMFGSVKALIDYLFGQTLIGSAVGATASTPDWLNQHARDRGTSRTDGEDDPTLRERLRNVPDALTRVSILVAIDAVLVAAGITDPAGLVELPQHSAHSGSWDVVNGVGGTIAPVSGTTYKFTPAVLPWPRPPFWPPLRVPTRVSKLWFNTVGGNAGVFTVTSLDGNAAVYTNPTAVPGVLPAIPWQWRTYNAEGNLTNGEGRAFSRGGYRSARLKPPRLIVILPFGTSAATALAVTEALRTKKAAGVAVTVERRLIAP